MAHSSMLLAAYAAWWQAEIDVRQAQSLMVAALRSRTELEDLTVHSERIRRLTRLAHMRFEAMMLEFREAAARSNARSHRLPNDMRGSETDAI